VVKASELIGRSVVAREGGKEVGKVKDLVVDQAGKQVLGFIVSEGLIRRTKVARWAALQAVGPDSIVIDSPLSVVEASEVAEIKAVLDRGTNIRGLRVQTTAGKELGKVEDFQLHETSGALEGFELSGGLLSDTFGGRSFLPMPLTIELGKDVAFVDPEVEATLQQSGGIKGAFKHSE